MLQIKCGKPEKRKGVLIHPNPAPRGETKQEGCAFGFSTSLKDVFKKHLSIRKQNISEDKDT